MPMLNGYYSIMQYCPDLSRMEAVNVGVVLFCPEAKFIEARTSAGNDKARSLFGRENVDGERLNAAKAAMEARFREGGASFRELPDLEAFVRTRANEILLTAPRAVKLTSPADDLGRLFKELVGGRSRAEPKPEPFPELHELFRKLAQKKRARLDYRVTIPVVNRTIAVPYAYRNGVLNLVKPQVFSADEKRATDLAMRLALEGDLIEKHSKKAAEPSRLIVVSAFEGGQAKDMRARVFELFREYHVEPVAREELPRFSARVASEAHASGR